MRTVLPSAGRAHLNRIVDALIDVDTSVGRRRLPVQLVRQLGRIAPRAMVILITPLIEQSRPELAVEIARSGHPVLVIDSLGDYTADRWARVDVRPGLAAAAAAARPRRRPARRRGNPVGRLARCRQPEHRARPAQPGRLRAAGAPMTRVARDPGGDPRRRGDRRASSLVLAPGNLSPFPVVLTVLGVAAAVALPRTVGSLPATVGFVDRLAGGLGLDGEPAGRPHRHRCGGAVRAAGEHGARRRRPDRGAGRARPRPRLAAPLCGTGRWRRRCSSLSTRRFRSSPARRGSSSARCSWCSRWRPWPVTPCAADVHPLGRLERLRIRNSRTGRNQQ